MANYDKKNGKKNDNNSNKRGYPEFKDSKESKKNYSKTNDPSWYIKDAQRLNDVGRINFSWPTGNRIKVVDDASPSPYTQYLNSESVPGVMAIYLKPFVGMSRSKYSPLNLGAAENYSFIRYKNSGHANYEQADLMKYYIAMGQVHQMYEWGKRLYGVLNTYSPDNRYYPRAIVQAMGFDWDDFILHIADLRSYLNNARKRIMSRNIPAGFGYLDRTRWLYSGLYCDSTTAKAQTYLFTPESFFLYMEPDEVKESFGVDIDSSILLSTSVPTRGHAINYDTYTGYLNKFIGNVMDVEDFGIMSGDVEKAYGGSLATLEVIDDDYKVYPVYDSNVLSQIHNATLLNLNITGLDPDQSFTSLDFIYQSTDNPTWGALMYTPTMGANETATIPVYEGYRLLDIDKDGKDITPSDVIESTRLMTQVSRHEGENLLYIEQCGTEIATGASIGVLVTTNGVTDIKWFDDYTYATELNIGTAAGRNKVLNYSPAQAFDWCPRAILLWNANGTPIGRSMYGDIANVAILDAHDLDKIHENVILDNMGVK